MFGEDQDDKGPKGKFERIYISQIEYYDLRHFIDNYLIISDILINDTNRDKIRNAIREFPGEAPVQRDELIAYLNDKLKK